MSNDLAPTPNNQQGPFVHLHTHSDYSLLTGLTKVEQMVKKAKKDGMTALALTDLGVMYGAIDFYRTCQKNGIKPIIGVDVNIAPNGLTSKRPKVDEERHSLVLLAKNNQGYQNLLKIVSVSFLDGFYYRPRVDLELLKKHSEGLIALSGSLHGEIPKAILKNYSQEKLDHTLGQYLDIFGKDNFFIEIIRHPHISEQELVNKHLIALAERHNLKIVAAANSFYLNTEDAQAHDILLCIKNNRKVFEHDRGGMMGEDYSLLSSEEMKRRFADIPEAITNAVEIAEMCNVKIEFGVNKLPNFPLPEGVSDTLYLKKLCLDGLVGRYGGVLDEATLFWGIDEQKPIIVTKDKTFFKKDIVERLDFELSVIGNSKLDSYFLIVADFINWAKLNGIVVGPGRGSAAGSIVAYLTNITDLDPLAYDLLFERFLNPERVSMPDIDTDFADTGRERVIQYVRQKYGEHHVSGIATFGTLGAKAVIRDVGRALGLEYSYCDRISKMIPVFTSLSAALEEVPEIKAEYRTNKDCQTLIDNGLKLEGVHRHASTHACGILITKDPLEEYVPLQSATNGVDETLVSQYSLDPVEKLGLLKMDFLGLSNLTIIENTLEAIEKIHGIKVDVSKLDLTDQKTFELLQRGETTGVFQFESSGMKRYLKMLKPTVIEDIIAMGALYRPGPLDAGMVDEFIDRKNGKKAIVYQHPKLEPILKNTYGVIVYQEQVMRIARDLAGFTLGEADVLRKAVGKKIKELMDEQEALLVNGMLKNGINRALAKEMWRQIETFARYGFNRSHAACYGLISFQTAFLKANYAPEFMASLLTSDLDDIDRIAIEVQECRSMGLEVMPPDINESFSRFTVVAQSLKDGKPRIRFGLTAIKGLGDNIAHQIIKERREGGTFKNLEDFLLRVNSKDLNKKSMDALIRSGAFDHFGDRSIYLANMERILAFVKEHQKDVNRAQHSLFALNDTGVKAVLQLEQFEPVDKMIKLSWEKELLGFYLSEHPYSIFEEQLKDYVISTSYLAKHSTQGTVRVAGLVQTVKKIVTKKGEMMAFITLEDTKGTIEVIVFPSVFAVSSDAWEENKMVIVSGTMSDRDGEIKVMCNEVKTINKEVVKKLASTLTKLNTHKQKEADDKKNLFVFFNDTIGAQTIQVLSDLLKDSPGTDKVYLAVPLTDKKFRKIETNYQVDMQKAGLIDQLSQIPEVKFVKLM